jgi:hypothetical protein
MPDGERMVILGGANVGDIVVMDDPKTSENNYEIFPRTAPADAKLRDLPVLKRAYPAPLYPILILMPNGYFFVMANMDAVLYNFDTGDEIILPAMPGAIGRSYPFTGEILTENHCYLFVSSDLCCVAYRNLSEVL